MRAARSLMLEEQRPSVGWICWAIGDLEENEAGEEGAASLGEPLFPSRTVRAGGVVLICPVRRRSLLPRAAWSQGAGQPRGSGPMQAF